MLVKIIKSLSGFFYGHVKKIKNPVCACKNWLVRREKSEKSKKKWAWKTDFERKKVQKKVKNLFSRPLSFSRKKKQADPDPRYQISDFAEAKTKILLLNFGVLN